jgi:hypothetical protein
MKQNYYSTSSTSFSASKNLYSVLTTFPFLFRFNSSIVSSGIALIVHTKTSQKPNTNGLSFRACNLAISSSNSSRLSYVVMKARHLSIYVLPSFIFVMVKSCPISEVMNNVACHHVDVIRNTITSCKINPLDTERINFHLKFINLWVSKCKTLKIVDPVFFSASEMSECCPQIR